MPLRSVEAATRDDAIAAAREQFGPSVRVVGVRRVRSGGVLGFFATERYVAEVAPDAGRPAVPAPASTRADAHDDLATADHPPADFSSPLASAAPARARSTAPARNGAAAWAAEARSSIAAGGPSRGAPPSRPPAAAPWAEDERVSELAGLLAGHPAEAQPSSYGRATFPGATATPPTVDDEPPAPVPPVFPTASFPATSFPATSVPATSSTPVTFPAESAPAGPSPFTAALARMVAGDREVRQAVADALDDSRASSPATSTRWPSRPAAVGPADTAVPSPATHREEETVAEHTRADDTRADRTTAEQFVAPPAADTTAPEVLDWAAEPETPAPATSSREEAIAEILRAALAQGPSDEALAGILRKVLAGASPQSALSEPDLAQDGVVEVEPVAEVEPLVEPEPEIGPGLVAPVAGGPTWPAVAAPVAPETEPPFMPRAAPSYWAAPAPLPAPATAMWGPTVSQAKLWDDPVVPVVKADAPIWAEVVLQDPAPAPDVEPAAEVMADPAPEVMAAPAPEVMAEPAIEDAEPLAEAAVEEMAAPAIEEGVPAPADDVRTADEQAELAAAEEVVEEFLAEVEIDEIAPVLARTASDPAPMMSLDSTSVMPPLSLLPPLPGSRGRSRPPVPAAVSRTAIPSSTPAAAPVAPESAGVEAAGVEAAGVEAAGVEAAGVEADEESGPAVELRGLRSLATVTRLPVAPPAGQEAPELAEPAVVEEPEAETSSASEALVPPADVQASVAVPDPTTPPAPGDVCGRLEALGLPRHLLGPSFAGEVERHGAYAALTHALALGLPRAPEVPTGPGEALFVAGPGVEALRAARTLAALLRLDPDRVQWATRGDLAGLAPRAARISTIDTAIERRQDAIAAGTVTIVAVDAPLRADAWWMTQMLETWTPAAVWAVVEATRKPEDLEPWLDRLPRVDALVVQDTEFSADPAAVLRRIAAPVAMVDGIRATPHRWASLLCERLENPQT